MIVGKPVVLSLIVQATYLRKQTDKINHSKDEILK